MMSEISPTFLAQVLKRRQELTTSLAKFSNLAWRFKVLEIGSGHGDFLAQYAQAFPDKFCLGIDIINKRVQQAQRKVQHLDNSSFIKAEADELLACLPEDVVWDEIFVLYPDPWPKRRHCKNRLFQADFLTQLAKLTRPHACLNFETDFQPYYESVCQLIQSHPSWQLVSTQAKYVINTVFAKITGKNAYHAIFERI